MELSDECGPLEQIIRLDWVSLKSMQGGGGAIQKGEGQSKWKEHEEYDLDCIKCYGWYGWYGWYSSHIICFNHWTVFELRVSLLEHSDSHKGGASDERGEAEKESHFYWFAGAAAALVWPLFFIIAFFMAIYYCLLKIITFGMHFSLLLLIINDNLLATSIFGLRD